MQWSRDDDGRTQPVGSAKGDPPSASPGCFATLPATFFDSPLARPSAAPTRFRLFFLFRLRRRVFLFLRFSSLGGSSRYVRSLR